MKSKKIMGLLLAGAIMVGTAAYASYAWFTDRSETDANITISMGNLDIELEEPVAEEQWWAKLPSESGDQEDSPINSFGNVRPGDVFERTVRLVNIGTLKANVDIAVADLADKTVGTKVVDGVEKSITFSEVFDLSYKIIDITDSEEGVEVDKIIEAEKEDTFKIVLDLAVKTDLGNELNYNNGSTEFFNLAFDDLIEDTKFLTFTASQINETQE